MATDVFFEDGSIKITGTEATFGPRTYDLDQIKDVQGYFERPPIAWFGAVLAVVGLVAVLAKSFLPISDTGALYQLLNIIGLPFLGIGAALFLFMSKYAVKLQTTSGPVEVLSVRNRAYAQRVSDALVAALKARTVPAPAARRATTVKSKR